MSALVATNNPTRHILGDLVVRFYNISGGDTDTMTVPQTNILFAIIGLQLKNIDVGITISGSVLTFSATGAFTGTLMVISREG